MKDLKGLNLSIMGDSISAFVGTIPEGFKVYYTGENSGVDNYKQMWWNVICENTGMVPCSINASSGCWVAPINRKFYDFQNMCHDSRCNVCNKGDINPDVIIIAGGVNDYTYSEEFTTPYGDWDGVSEPCEYNNFGEAYAVMLLKLKKNYPNAKIVCLSTWFTMRGTMKDNILVNGMGHTQEDYNIVIESVAKKLDCIYLDVYHGIGFTKDNFYPKYVIDSDIIPTHPNAAGQKAMGDYIAKKLYEIL